MNNNEWSTRQINRCMYPLFKVIPITSHPHTTPPNIYSTISLCRMSKSEMYFMTAFTLIAPISLFAVYIAFTRPKS